MDPNQTPPPVATPFGFPAVFPVTADDRSRILPYNLATSGVWPGNTDMQINGNAVVISGRNQSITMSDLVTGNTVMSILGASGKGYMLFTDPSTGINRVIIGKLPDGTFGMVVSKTGIDVLSVFV